VRPEPAPPAETFFLVRDKPRSALRRVATCGSANSSADYVPPPETVVAAGRKKHTEHPIRLVPYVDCPTRLMRLGRHLYARCLACWMKSMNETSITGIVRRSTRFRTRRSKRAMAADEHINDAAQHVRFSTRLDKLDARFRSRNPHRARRTIRSATMEPT